MAPTTFRRLALVAWVFQALIVVSGAAVRLTDAGLGCEDWPTCSEDRLAPEWQLHGWIEFGNRLISLVVALSTVALIIAAYRRRPRRSDLIGLSWALVAGTMAQIVLGGITVLLELTPIAVAGHFLLSMWLLWAATKLWWRTTPGGAPEPASVGDTFNRRLARAVLPLASVVLLTGTVVTGSGPNSGDSRADRLGWGLTEVARIHSISVWLLVASLVLLGVRLTIGGLPGSNDGVRFPPATLLRILLAIAAVQGAVGYTQFALGVPAGLVEVHVAGAVLVWIGALILHLRVFDNPPSEPTAGLATTPPADAVSA